MTAETALDILQMWTSGSIREICLDEIFQLIDYPDWRIFSAKVHYDEFYHSISPLRFIVYDYDDQT